MEHGGTEEIASLRALGTRLGVDRDPEASRMFASALDALEERLRVDRLWRLKAEAISRIALDLSRPRNREDTLGDIVAQGRQLLQSDMCYISLNDESTGTTVIQTTTGVATEAYRTLRMPLGTGVLGSVAASRQPVQSSDYLEDSSLRHLPEVDVIVREEGVRAILGAPMRIRGSIIGALVVADRHPRTYDILDISTVDVLASLAAVALETSQLISSLTASVSELQASEARTQENVNDLQRLADAEGSLLAALVEGDEFSLSPLLEQHLGAPTAVRVDRIADTWTTMTDIAPDLDRLRTASAKTNAAEIDTSVPATVLAISVAGRPIGAVAVRAALSKVEVQILQSAAVALSARVFFNEAVDSAHRRELDDLMRSVLSGRSSARERAELAQLSRFDLRSLDALRITTLQCADRQAVADVVISRLRECGTAFIHGDHVCVLTDPADETAGHELAGALAVLAARGLEFAGGQAQSAVAEISSAHARSVALGRAGRGLGRTYEVSTAESMGSIGLLLGEDVGLADRIARECLGPVIDYDAKHGTHLTQTAAAYFDLDANVARTSAALVVHENTVRQRLERIADLLGAGWNSGSRALDTHIALRAWTLRFDVGT